MNLIHGGHPTIYVTDMDSAIAFYADTLGSTFRKRACLFWINRKSVLMTDCAGVRGIGFLCHALHMRRRKKKCHGKQTTRTG